MLETDRTFGLTHAYFKALEGPFRALKVVTECGQPGVPQAPSPHCLPWCGSHPVTRKSSKGPPLSVAAGLLFTGAFVFYSGTRPHVRGKSSGGIRRRQLSAGLSGVLGVAPLSICKGFLRWAREPPRAASPGPCTHLNSVRQVGAHPLPSCTPISKPLRHTPSVCLPVIESLHSYFCTNMLGTLYKVHT